MLQNLVKNSDNTQQEQLVSTTSFEVSAGKTWRLGWPNDRKKESSGYLYIYKLVIWYWLSARTSASLSARILMQPLSVVSLYAMIRASSQHSDLFFWTNHSKFTTQYSVSHHSTTQCPEPSPSHPPSSSRVCQSEKKKKKRTLDFCSSSGGRGLGPGSLFAQVAAGRKADPSMPRDWGFRLQQEREFATRSRNRACVCGRGVAGRVPRELVGSAWYFYALVFGSYSVTSAVCFSWSKYKVLPNFKMKNIDHSIW